MEYKIVGKGAFETMEKFEKKLNDMASQGWKVVTSMHQGSYLVLVKERH